MTEQLKRHLGAAVHAARRRAGLTQEELAGRIGRTPESVSNLERGVHLPTLETLFDLAGALQIPVAAFLADAGDTRPLARERIMLEAKLREAARRLDDRDLAIAVDQVEAFSRSG